MKIKISGHHVEISEAVKHHVSAKIDKIVNRFSGLTSTSVIIIKEHGEFIVDIATNYEGRSVAAKGTDKVMYPAIAQAVKKLETVLTHRKGQLRQDLHRKPVLATPEISDDEEVYIEYDEVV